MDFDESREQIKVLRIKQKWLECRIRGPWVRIFDLNCVVVGESHGKDVVISRRYFESVRQLVVVEA